MGSLVLSLHGFRSRIELSANIDEGDLPPNLRIVIRPISQHPEQVPNDGKRLFDQTRFGFIMDDTDVCLVQSK